MWRSEVCVRGVCVVYIDRTRQVLTHGEMYIYKYNSCVFDARLSEQKTAGDGTRPGESGVGVEKSRGSQVL
jgi:hypothetical protein